MAEMAVASERGERRLGTVLVLASAAVFGLAGTLTKSNGAEPWTIACWRGLVGAVLIAAYVLVRRDGKPLRRACGRGGGVGLLAAADAAFIAAFKATHVANVAVIVASGPGAGDLAGDALALAMTALCALYLVLIRAFRDAAVVWAGALSGLILFAAGWVVADPLAISGRDVLLVAAFGASFAVAVILWTEGARLIPAAEAGLVGAAEIPCAVLVAFFLLGESPPLASLADGAILLAALLWNAWRDLAAAPPPT